jgi:hypothetical protein
MVDLVARIVADDDERILSFKPSEVIFGGGRLTVRNKEIPLDYAAFCEVYQEANQKALGAVKREGNTQATPAPETEDSGEQRPTRRGRAPKEEPAPVEQEAPPATNATTTPPWEGDEEKPELPKCPDADRIFEQHKENPEIPLCPSIDAAQLCHKDGGPDGCPLWDRPKAPANEEAAPMMDVNPPRRSRKKRGE